MKLGTSATLHLDEYASFCESPLSNVVFQPTAFQQLAKHSGYVSYPNKIRTKPSTTMTTRLSPGPNEVSCDPLQ